MSLFYGTYEFKVDGKGRVSVPADFRHELAGGSFNGVIIYRSFEVPAIEACTSAHMEHLQASLDTLDFYSPVRRRLETMLFGRSQRLSFDTNGRIMLPPPLMESVGIEGMAKFIGRGRTFQIWEPAALDRHMAECEEELRREPPSLVPVPGGLS